MLGGQVAPRGLTVLMLAFFIAVGDHTVIGQACSGELANEVEFASFALLNGPSTLLSYLQSFGVSSGDDNLGEGPWVDGFDSHNLTIHCSSSSDSYFETGRVNVIQGDGDDDSEDWTIFNFGPSKNGDYDGSADEYAFFGGEEDHSGGDNGQGFAAGRVWGKTADGWVELYTLPLDEADPYDFGDEFLGKYTHQTGSWLQAGGSYPASVHAYGKRPEYDTLIISEVGFSVSNIVPNPCDGDLVLSLYGCACPGIGFQQDGNVCTCPFTQIQSADGLRCTCPQGFYDDGSGQCLIECPAETAAGRESDAVLFLRATANEFVVADRDFAGQTLLEYLASFNLPLSSGEGPRSQPESAWINGHDTLTLSGVSVCYGFDENPYFNSFGGRALVLNGDGNERDSDDFAIFNFGPKNGEADFQGEADYVPFFGGEYVSASPGEFYNNNVAYGTIWGYNDVSGWNILFVLPMHEDDESYDNQNSAWWRAGDTTTSGYGKREAFDSLPLSKLAFSVSYNPVQPFTRPGPACPGCHEDAICAVDSAGNSTCSCRQGFEGDGVTRCENINECQDDSKTASCDHLAYCIDTLGSYQCECPEGFLGDGFSCSNTAWSIRSVLEFEATPLLSPAQFRLMYARVLLGATVDEGEPLVETLSVKYVDIAMGSQVTLNALFPSQALASAALASLNLELLDWSLFGSGFQDLVDGPEVYRWVGRSSSDTYEVSPSGVTVENVVFQPGCLSSGCWVVSVTYTTGTNDINAFYLPVAEGNDGLSYDFDYSRTNAAWMQSAADTFFPNTHPCTTADHDNAEDLRATASACCLKQFTEMYRPVGSFAAAVASTPVADCTTGARDRTVDRTAVPILSTATMKPAGAMRDKNVFVDGIFAGLEHSYGQAAGVVDPYIGIYKARFYLDEVELRTEAGQLRGTVGVEHTIDTFLGLLNLSPTGTAVLDSFATQAALHLEKTNFFSVSTHGVNDYTFLEYVNLRLIAVYNEDADFSGLDEEQNRTVRTDPDPNANYVQITFTMGSQYQPNPASGGLIPLDSVRAGRGTFMGQSTLVHLCSMYTEGDADAGDDVGLTAAHADDIAIFDSMLEQGCSPNSAMCVSPTSVPDQFVSFNIPLGFNVFGDYTSDTLQYNIFVDMVINALDTDKDVGGTAGPTPNEGDDPMQMKTTLTASIPIVAGGINIFCDGITAKTDLKDIANADIIIGSASNATELTRLRVLKDVSRTNLRPVPSMEVDTDSIEAGLMTLVIKGNATYFTKGLLNSAQINTQAYSLELDDLITIHLMTDGEAPSETDAECRASSQGSRSVDCQVRALLAELPDDNSDSNGLITDGYFLNGAFKYDVNRGQGSGRLDPTAALLQLCPFNPTRPAGGLPLESCITRRDVRARTFPVRQGAQGPTAMELLASLDGDAAEESVAEALDAQLPREACECEGEGECCEAGFMQMILGENDYARALAVDYAKAIHQRYGLNGRYTRAFWINPGYEWTPTQTAGRSLFSVSQKMFLFALISLDENISRRRMLLNSDVNLLFSRPEDAGSGAGGAQLSFPVSRSSIMAQAFDVPVEKAVRFNVEMQLTEQEACMSDAAFVAHARVTFVDFLDTSASSFHSVQVLGFTRALHDHACRRALRLRKLLGFSAATAAVQMLIVFKDEGEAVFNDVAFAAMAGITAVAADPSSASHVKLDATYKNDVPNSQADAEGSASSSIDSALVGAIAGGAGGALVAVAGVLFWWRARGIKEENEISAAVTSINVNDLKAQLSEEL